MNKNSISHGVPKEHLWPLIWLWVTQPLEHPSHPWYMQGKDGPYPCLLDLKHEGFYLTEVHLPSCLLSTSHLGSLGGGRRRDISRGWASLHDLHAWQVHQRLQCHHTVLVVLRELGMAALSLWQRNCLNSVPREFCLSAGHCPWPVLLLGIPGAVPGQQLPQPLLCCWLSGLAPSVQLTALPAGGKWVTLHENLLGKLVLVLLGSLSCTGR